MSTATISAHLEEIGAELKKALAEADIFFQARVETVAEEPTEEHAAVTQIDHYDDRWITAMDARQINDARIEVAVQVSHAGEEMFERQLNALDELEVEEAVEAFRRFAAELAG